MKKQKQCKHKFHLASFYPRPYYTFYPIEFKALFICENCGKLKEIISKREK